MAITVDAIEYPPGSGTYISVGSGTDYGGRFLATQPYGGMRGQPIEQSRAGTSAAFQGMSVSSRPMPITFVRDTGGSTSNTNFHANLFKYFNPEARNSDGVTTRYLRCTWHDGSTVVRMPVNVVSIAPRANYTEIIDVQVQATWPYLEATSAESTATVGVDTPNNAGNVDAGPLITITGTDTPNAAYRFDITETAGIGGSDLPVLLDPGSAVWSTTSATYVFDQDGKSVPFTITSSRYVWTTCSIDPSDTISFYVVYNAGFSNPKADTLDWNEFYTSNTSNASNEQDGFLISSNPSRTGLWHPQQLNFAGGAGTAWGYSSTEAATNMVYTLYADPNDGLNDANGMVIVTGIPADTITGLSRAWAGHTTDVESFVWYRQAGQTNWTSAWSTAGAGASGSATGTITMVDAVEIAIGIRATGSSPTDGATLTLSGTGTPDITINYDTGKDFSISATSISAHTKVVDGNITNSTTGQVITFDDLLFYDATDASEIMYLDFRPEATKRIYSRDTSNGIVLGKDSAISFTDPVKGLALAPGNNTVTESVTGSVTLDFRSTFG